MKKIGWHGLFLDLVDAKKNTEFKWGETDCALFAADAVKIMTDTDFAEEFRGKYKSKSGAAKVLKDLGFKDLDAAISSKFEPIDRNFSQRGDVVLFQTDLGPTTGIYWNGGAFSTAPEGVRLFPSIHMQILKAWRV